MTCGLTELIRGDSAGRRDDGIVEDHHFRQPSRSRRGAARCSTAAALPCAPKTGGTTACAARPSLIDNDRQADEDAQTLDRIQDRILADYQEQVDADNLDADCAARDRISKGERKLIRAIAKTALENSKK